MVSSPGYYPVLLPVILFMRIPRAEFFLYRRMNAIAAIVKQFDENKTLGGNLKVETRNGSLVVALAVRPPEPAETPESTARHRGSSGLTV